MDQENAVDSRNALLLSVPYIHCVHTSVTLLFVVQYSLQYLIVKDARMNLQSSGGPSVGASPQHSGSCVACTGKVRR